MTAENQEEAKDADQEDFNSKEEDLVKKGHFPGTTLPTAPSFGLNKHQQLFVNPLNWMHQLSQLML